MHTHADEPLHAPLFQSAPGLEAGRCTTASSALRSIWVFQSAPGLEAGRCSPLSRRPALPCTFQSAPGLEAGRCVDMLPPKLKAELRFNPRPA